MLAIIDERLFNYLYSMTAASRKLACIMTVIAAKSSLVFQAIYFLSVIILLVKIDGRIIPFVIGPASGLAATRLLRMCSRRKRPFIALGLESLIAHDDDSSFPSRHASSAFVIAMSIWHINQPVGVIMILLAGVTGMSRVMVGVHYPSDILTGAIIGILISTAVFSLVPY